jgi:very-short-patch-repair endonuclease
MTNYNKLSDKEKSKLLNDLYVKQKHSFKQIADGVGSYANKIRRDAIKFKIPIRDKSEAQKNALVLGTTKHPTKGKKRSESTKQKIGLSVLENWESMSDSEIQQRKLKAQQQWNNMDEQDKQNMLEKANKAVRESSKVGSKLENFLLEGLLKNNIKVDFHKEHNLINTKLQIDLFLPELNIAIEVDGPSHFLPVWGEDALERNVKYDNKKNGLLLGKGCVIIRVKQTKDFSPSRGRLILQELLNHINNIKTKYPESNNRIIEIGD